MTTGRLKTAVGYIGDLTVQNINGAPYAPVPGGGTVTTVSVVSANGVTGSVANATTTPAISLTIGAITPSSLNATGAIKTSSPSAGLGYSTGAGAAATQTGSRSAGVTCNGMCGAITTHNASVPVGQQVVFTVTNSAVSVGDVVMVCSRSGQTAGTSFPFVSRVANGSFDVTLENLSLSTADTGAMVINFAILKAVSA